MLAASRSAFSRTLPSRPLLFSMHVAFISTTISLGIIHTTETHSIPLDNMLQGLEEKGACTMTVS